MMEGFDPNVQTPQEITRRRRCEAFASPELNGMFYNIDLDLFCQAFQQPDGVWTWENGSPVGRVWTCADTGKRYIVMCSCRFLAKYLIQVDALKTVRILAQNHSVVDPLEDCTLPKDAPQGWVYSHQ